MGSRTGSRTGTGRTPGGARRGQGRGREGPAAERPSNPEKTSTGTGPGTLPLDAAKALALRVLSFHARSTAQLRARLARAGFEEHADEVVAWAARLGYLDDAAYARARARSLLSAGRAGPRRASLELRRAGVPDAEASRAVAVALADRAAELPGGEPPEVALCRAAAHRRLGGEDPTALGERERARLARWLLGRGFSGGAVARVVGLAVDSEA